MLRDTRDRVWLTVSTRVNPWTRALADRVRDGYVAVVEDGRIRVVADGFHFTNEIRLDAREQWLYIVETTGPRITRMRLDESRPGEVRLVDREIFGPAHLGGLPDGIAFDAHGNLWATLIMVDRLIALTPQGDMRLLLDDGDAEASANRCGASTRARCAARTCSARAPSRRGWPASPSAARTCAPCIWAACSARAFPASARLLQACRWRIGAQESTAALEQPPDQTDSAQHDRASRHPEQGIQQRGRQSARQSAAHGGGRLRDGLPHRRDAMGQMAPPTMNMAAVPATDSAFISQGAAPTMRSPIQATARERFRLRYSPRSSSLTMPATSP